MKLLLIGLAIGVIVYLASGGHIIFLPLLLLVPFGWFFRGRTRHIAPATPTKAVALAQVLAAHPHQPRRSFAATRPGGAEAEAAADAPDLDEAVADALVIGASPRSPGAHARRHRRGARARAAP
jgi:hypothetical protein